MNKYGFYDCIMVQKVFSTFKLPLQCIIIWFWDIKVLAFKMNMCQKSFRLWVWEVGKQLSSPNKTKQNKLVSLIITRPPLFIYSRHQKVTSSVAFYGFDKIQISMIRTHRRLPLKSFTSKKCGNTSHFFFSESSNKKANFTWCGKKIQFFLKIHKFSKIF